MDYHYRLYGGPPIDETEIDLDNDEMPIRDSSEVGNLKHKTITLTNLLKAIGVEQLQEELDSKIVTWPLIDDSDPRGSLFAETFDPETSTFWKKASISPDLWLPLTGGVIPPVENQMLWGTDGEPALWGTDGEPWLWPA